MNNRLNCDIIQSKVDFDCMNENILADTNILNVKAHKDIRKYILEVAGLISITTHEDMFSSVTTKYIDIMCGNSADKKQFMFCSKNEKRYVDIQTVYETENLIFNLLSDNDISIIQIIKNKGKYSLQDSIWALGVVTGDNKDKLFSECHNGMEKIYTALDCSPNDVFEFVNEESEG